MTNGDWNNLKFKYTIGEYIEGIVVKQEPFGVFVDIGEMFDAIVLVPEMLESQKTSMSNYPKIGHKIKCSVVAFTEAENILSSYVSLRVMSS